MESLVSGQASNVTEGLREIVLSKVGRRRSVRRLVLSVLFALILTLPAWAQCPSSLSPAAANVPARAPSADGATRDSFRVFGTDNCKWRAESQVPWITISFGQTGTNNGTVGYAVQQNMTPVSRTGAIKVNDLPFAVVQGGSNCSLTLGGTGATYPAIGGSGSFRVETTCQWSATSNVQWISVSGGGTGSGTVTYTVLPNPAAASRTGLISIYDRNFVITQDPSPCTISVTPSSDTVPAIFAGVKTARIDTPAGCAWAVSNPAAWVRASPASGSGSGLISLKVDNNLFAEKRTAVLSIGGASYTLTQDGAACQFSLTPASSSISWEGASGSFSVGTTCNYTVQSNSDWLILRSSSAGSGSGRVDYTVLENKTSEPRTGSIRVGTATFTLTQAAMACTVLLDPPGATFTSANGSGTIRVTASSACWEAESFSPWVTITSSASTSNGSGSVTYTVDSNPNSPSRTGTIRIGPGTFTITQAGVGVFFTAEGVAHGATAQAGPIAPGEVIVIYGSGMGPAAIVTAQLSSDGTALTASLAGTRVLFNGVPGAMIYTSAGQVATVAPYSVVSKAFADVVVEYNAVQSSVVTLPVTPYTPGIFTANKSGTGLGAILNQDYSDNALVPAQKGSVVQIFATGEGETLPPSVDGKLSAAPLPKPKVPVRVYIDGIEAEVSYYGAAPGLVAGVLQVNARIPSQARSGALPLLLRMGDTYSRPGVNVSVK